MKKIISLLAGFMFCLFASSAQEGNITRTMSPNDSLTVSVKFERVQLSKEETSAQVEFNTLLNNSVKTTEVLSTSLNRLTSAVQQNIELSKLTKADIVAKQLGITKESFNKYYKRNNTLLLLSLLPVLIIAFWSMGSFLLQKGLDIKHLLAGTATMTLYGFIGSTVLYVVLSLICNKEYFIIKSLMSSMF